MRSRRDWACRSCVRSSNSTAEQLISIRKLDAVRSSVSLYRDYEKGKRVNGEWVKGSATNLSPSPLLPSSPLPFIYRAATRRCTTDAPFLVGMERRLIVDRNFFAGCDVA